MSQNDEREQSERDALWPQWRAALSQRAEVPPECTRSHPHENMDGFCKLRTEIARLTNENARLLAAAPQPQQAEQPRQMVALTDEQIEQLQKTRTFAGMHPEYLRDCVREVERAHGIATGGKE